jgi:carboxylesterase type B
MQLLLTTVVASLFASALAAPTNTSSVETSSGTLIGHESSNKTHVIEFLGIRYAEAPVGELRFAAPKKYVAPAGTVFEASNWVC